MCVGFTLLWEGLFLIIYLLHLSFHLKHSRVTHRSTETHQPNIRKHTHTCTHMLGVLLLWVNIVQNPQGSDLFREWIHRWLSHIHYTLQVIVFTLPSLLFSPRPSGLFRQKRPGGNASYLIKAEICVQCR